MAKNTKNTFKPKNKLSRSYKFKKRTGKINKPKDDAPRSQIKQARIIIRNLSFKTTEADIKRLYEPFGQIEEIKLLKRPDGKLVGCGFVQFKDIKDASKAIFKTNKSEFLGRTITSEFSIPKSEFTEKLKQKEVEINEDKKISNNGVRDDLEEQENLEKLENYDEHKSKKKFTKKSEISKAEQRKLYKLKKRKKRSRIVIRNMPFGVTEEPIREQFAKYGLIEEVNILKKPDGTPTGCCFLQFARVQSAAQAIHHENMKTFLDRSIVVDWAIPKDKFQKSTNNKNPITENENGEVEIKTEDDKNEIQIKQEIDSDEIKEETGSVESQSIDGNDDVNSDNEDDDDDDDDEDKSIDITSNNEEDEEDNDDNDNKDDKCIDDKKNIKLELQNESKGPRRISNDVSEGKTVFIKNVPFTATNEDLKQCMMQFGPVYYALVCIDPLTEHSKGTAFVKFRNTEDAEKCLAAGTELQLHNQVLDPHKAMHKNEIEMKSKEKKQKNIKDSRNLYLVKEGVILAGSAAAKDLSTTDMARRLQLEQWKSQMLRNLNMFVSRVRLVIQNLPESTDDAKLRQLFKNHSNPNAVITEARVMRDLRNVDANGVGKSKEYGFVSFTNHEDALKALRSLNNNPNIFTKTKRPIVAFSIENRIMVNAKKKRVEKSRQRNPLYNNNKRKGEQNEVADDKVKGGRKQQAKRRKKSVPEKSTENAKAEDDQSYLGTTSKPGSKRITSKYFIKKQANLYNENLKQRKKQLRNLKQTKIQKKEQLLKRKEAKVKQGSKKLNSDDANLERIVNKYKKQLTSGNSKGKWYES